MASTVRRDLTVREITDTEISFYHEHGWVKLDGLIDPEFAAEILRTARDRVEPDPRGGWASLRGPAARGEEPCHSIVFSECTGRGVQRMINRPRLTDADVPVRYRWDVVVKREHEGEQATEYHQDSCASGSDRIGELNFWLALDEVTPEMGAMRFLSGSHREGLLGYCSLANEPDVLDRCPKLLEMYEFSPPFYYRPGDATVHNGYLIHGAPPNVTDRPRWSYIFGYTPADTRYFQNNDGTLVRASERQMLRPETNPIVYPKQEPAKRSESS